MKRFLLDTSALVAVYLDEPGADRIGRLLAEARNGELLVHVCFVTEVEVAYRIWRKDGKAAADQACSMLRSLPVTWINDSAELRRTTIELKATNPMSLADAWIAAAAQLTGSTLVHKDPEFLALQMPQEVLPLKQTT